MTVIDSSKHRQLPYLGDNISNWFDGEPAAAALAAQVVYGPDAALAVAWCALSAKIDGRVSDGHFWFAVFNLLHSGGSLSVGPIDHALPLNAGNMPH
ncbi:hypothetical protein QD460_31165 [Rhizobium jaguaris]|uniref:Uncharacterized protein n=1 Tax=Rhizobium jaguaris TaxID=1312183 RepID=A0A387FUB9_9HYPH|nr:hypothetical protein [Rhizobium jaguaris]AYG62168.1 hypothetical protein CCGE525_25355 [Rhizobium jaguaris]